MNEEKQAKLASDLLKIDGVKTVTFSEVSTMSGNITLTVAYVPQAVHSKITEMQQKIAVLLSQSEADIVFIDYKKA